MTTQPILSATEDWELACPACQDTTDVHVDSVAMTDTTGRGLVLYAPEEDAAEGQIPAAGISIDHRLTSARRHTVVLVIECLACGKSTRLALIQHKGATQVRILRVG